MVRIGLGAEILKFRLAHKGLILVGIPLILELVLFTEMFSLLQQAEQSAEKANKSRQVLSAITKLTSDIVAFEKIGIDKRLYFRNLDDEAFKALMDKTIEDFENLDKLIKNNSRYKEFNDTVPKMMADVKKLSPELIDYYEKKDYKNAILVGNKFKTYFSDLIKEGTGMKLLLYAAEEREIDKNEPKYQAKIRKRTRTLLAWGLLLSFFICGALAVFFSRQISKRLAVINDNNERLLSNQTLNPQVKGSDEITDLDRNFHQMAEKLNIAREKEKEAQRMRDQILAMVTHDLRAPLQTISTFLEYADAVLASPQDRELLKVAERNTMRMGQLINDLLDLEKLKEGKMKLDMKNFSSDSAIQQAQELTSALAKHKNVEIAVSGSADIFGDEYRVVQIVSNLLSNAIKYSPDGSTVSVQVSSTEETANIKISDSGRGIPKEMIDEIFQPFQQVHSTDATKFGGSGFGLAICKALIDLHGGSISVEANQPTGSVFSFTLPRKDSRLAPLTTNDPNESNVISAQTTSLPRSNENEFDSEEKTIGSANS